MKESDGHYLICGVGVDQDLAAARSKALENGISEFEKLCAISQDCRGRESSATPRRTECTLKNGLHHCFRAFEFKVSTAPVVSIDTQSRQLDIEIEKTRERLREMAEFQRKQRELEILKEQERSGVIYEPTVDSFDRELVGKIGMLFNALPINVDKLEPGHSCCLGLLLGLDYNFLRSFWAGVFIAGSAGISRDSYGSGSVGEGAPNTTELKVSETAFSQFGMTLDWSFSERWGVYAEGGRADVQLSTRERRYDSLGRGSRGTEGNQIDFSMSFIGGGFAYRINSDSNRSDRFLGRIGIRTNTGNERYAGKSVAVFEIAWVIGI